LKRASLLHSEVVDTGKQHDRSYRNQPRSSIAQWHKVSDVTHEYHGNGCDDAGVHNPEHGPAPKKADRGRISLFEKDVDATGSRKGRCQLSAAECPKERQQTGHDPHGKYTRHRWDQPRNL